MTDFASLGIKIDSSQVKTATTDLDKLAAVGERAQKSIAATETSAKKMATGFTDGQKAVAASSRSIDNYIRQMQVTVATNGKGARETKLLELAIQGATKAQLQAADAAIRMNESYEKGVSIGQRLKVGFIALAAAAAAGVIATTKSSIDLLDKLDDISEKSGVSVERLSELRFAGETTGTSFDRLADGLTKLSREMAKAAGGNKDAAATFDAMGVSIANADGTLRNTGDVLTDIATKFAGYKDGAAKAALAQELFGRSGEDMIPLLNQGASGIAALSSEAKQLHAVYSGELAKSAAEFNDNLTKIKLGAEGAAVSLAGPLVGALARLSASYLQAKKDGDLLIPTLTTLLSLANPGALAVLGVRVATGTLFKARSEEADSELKRLEARSKSIKDTLAKVEAPLPVKPPPKSRAAHARVDNSEAQEAKAQLAYDLETIAKAQAALTNTIANGEKLLEAKRSANLVTEAAYWEQRRVFLVDNAAAEEQGLQKQLARLQQETFTGKNADTERLNNSRKIVDVEAKIAKARADGANAVEILKIRQTDALEQIRIKFEQATVAANSYVDTIAKQNSRELAGMGLGDRQRDIDGRRSQREDQFQSRRDQLDGQRRANQITQEEYQKYLAIEEAAHKRALAEDERYWDEKLKKQRDWSTGASEALANYYDESLNVADQMKTAFTDAFQGMEDSLVAFISTGKLDFKSLANSIIADISRIIIKQQIVGPLAKMLSGSLGSGSGMGGLVTNFFDSIFASAKGNVFASPGLSAYSGQVVSKPTLFPFARGMGLMGEAGPEAILPLKRGADGKLGVEAGAGGGGQAITLNMHVPPGTDRRTAGQWGAEAARKLSGSSRRFA